MALAAGYGAGALEAVFHYIDTPPVIGIFLDTLAHPVSGCLILGNV